MALMNKEHVMHHVTDMIRAWRQGWQARKRRRAAAQLSGLDTAFRRHQEECPEWRYNDEECSTCRKRRRRLQAAQHTLAQDVERTGVRMSGVAAATSGERNPQRLEEYAVAIADCREARRRLRQARVADLVDFQEAQRCQGEALLAECTAALQRAYDFILAEAFHRGATCRGRHAGWCYGWRRCPTRTNYVRSFDAKGTQGSTLSITVDDYLHYRHFLIEREYELYEKKTCVHLAAVLWERLPGLRPLYRAAIVAALGVDAWKPLAAHKEEALERALWLWERTDGCSRVERQSAVAYSVHHCGIDFTDEAALEALAAEAAVARHAAQQALDGAGNADDEETASAGEQGWEEEGADTYGENGAEETDDERGAPEVEAAPRRPLALRTPETTLPSVPRRGYHQYRHGLDDFLTAQASAPHEAWRTAAQVLIHGCTCP